jgi:NAD(P)-dependent dehydrogenase (short-subunit alcohol dehydrogenase family)
MQNFQGKTAVITGAASGIGRGLAGHCMREGMKVVLADIEETALKAVENELKSRGGNVLAVRTDVSKIADIEALAGRTMEVFGSVDLLFNNAGVQTEVQRSRDLWEFSLKDWEWVIGVNLWGIIYGLKTFVPIMLRQNTECHIVNTASVAGLASGGGMAMYRFTKTGVISLTESLYFQMQKKKAPIGVTVLCPVLVSSHLNDAERNRPQIYQNAPDNTPLSPEQQALKNMFIKGNDKGLPPAQYAELVFEAIRQNRLYVVEGTLFDAAIRQRTEDILARRNPEAKG